MENTYLEKVNRFKVCRQHTASFRHKDWMLYFSSNNLDTAKKIESEVNKKEYNTKIIDAGKETFVERLIY